MSIRKTSDLLTSGEHVERDLQAARMGERLTFVDCGDANKGTVFAACYNCKTNVTTHVRQSGILFCPEWALRDRWGR